MAQSTQSKSCQTNQLTYSQAQFSKQLITHQYFVHNVLPVTDNCPSQASQRGEQELSEDNAARRTHTFENSNTVLTRTPTNAETLC